MGGHIRERPSRRTVLRRALAGGVLCAATAVSGAYPALASQKSAPGGFSAQRLKRVTAAIEEAVDRGDVDGIVTVIFRHGILAQVHAVGWQDKTAHMPIARNSIFRIASMTKPVTSVATLLLIDDGKVKLDDPVDRWLPELANPKMLRDPSAPLDSAVPSPRPLRVVDLLTHRSGTSRRIRSPGRWWRLLKRPMPTSASATMPG